LRFLKGYIGLFPCTGIERPAEHDRAVELAKRCSECRQCVERCPYDLEIPDMLKENIRFYESFSAR